MAKVNGKSGTFNISTKNPYVSGYAKWQETYDDSTYLSTNTTNVKMDIYLHRTNVYNDVTEIGPGVSITQIGYFGANKHTDGTKTQLTIAGSSTTGTATSGGGAFTNVFSADWDILHNSDGTCSVVLGFEMSNNSSVTSAKNAFTVSKTTATVTLTSIPRASTFKSVTGNTIGSSVTVTLDVKSSSYTHQLWYKVGSSSWYDLGKFSGSTKTFTIDSSTANQFASSSSGTMQLCVRTYNGTTQIGSDVYKDVTVYVPGYNVSSSGITLTGNNLLSGMYVQDKSTVTVKISATTDYGASIVSYSSTIDGKTYSGNSFTTSPLSSGTHKVTTVIKDSRGQTATIESSSITVYSYANPRVSVSVSRDSSVKTKAYVRVTGSVSPVNNANTISVNVTLDGQSQEVSTSGYTFDETITFTGIDTDSTLNAIATVTDSFTTVSNGSVLSTVAVTLDFYNTGKGIAVGKVAEEDGLEVAWDTKFNSDVEIGGGATISNGLEVEGVSVFKGAVEFNNISDEGFVISSDYTNDDWPPAITFAMEGDPLGTIAMVSDGQLIRRDFSNYEDYTILDTGNIGAYLTSAISDNREVEHGTNSNWLYEKWDNGFLKLYRNFSVSNVAVTQAWGALYSSPQITLPTFPTTTGLKFTATPQVNLTWNGTYSAILDGATGVSTTKCGYVYIFRPDSVTLTSGSIAIQVVGKWK